MIALVPASGLMAQGTLERIADRGEFRIGYDPDGMPMSFVQNGEPAGYSVELCRRIAVGVRQHLELPDLELTFVPVSLDERFDAVVNGDIDIECGSTTITFERQERVDFTLMTFVTGATILSMAKDRIENMSELDDKRIAVIRGTTTESALAAYLSDNRLDGRVVVVADSAEGLSLLQRGDVDGYASDQIVLVGDATKAMEADSSLRFAFADDLFSYEPYGLMVPRNDAAFRLVVNRVIADIFRSGQYAEIFARWIGSFGVEPSPMLVAMYQVQALTE